MNQNEADRVVNNLMTKFGLPIRSSIANESNGQILTLEPIDVHQNEGFRIVVTIGWKSIFIEFVPGRYAADLLYQMSIIPTESRIIFSDLSVFIVKEKAELTLTINNKKIDPFKFEEWPENWNQFSFTLKKSPLDINTEDQIQTELLINNWIEKYTACIFTLIPFEEMEKVELKNDDVETGLPEGALTIVSVNRYERNLYNRTLCINFHGSTCKICNSNFEDIYGVIGRGFIHVHHLTPVSKLESNYIINPIKDLIPVCPNCHSILHKKDPPYTIEEVKSFMENSKDIT